MILKKVPLKDLMPIGDLKEKTMFILFDNARDGNAVSVDYVFEVLYETNMDGKSKFKRQVAYAILESLRKNKSVMRRKHKQTYYYYPTSHDKR